MREIKFRGKRINNRQWVDGSLILNPENKYPTIGDIYCEYDNGVKNNIFKEYSVDPKTVGQFTGLKDKNGKDIYEGDVVQSISGQTYVCVFRNGGFEFENIITKNYAIYGELWDLEIIGNIHENPELLN